MLLVILDLLFTLLNIIYVILYFNTARWKSNVIEVIPFLIKLDEKLDDEIVPEVSSTALRAPFFSYLDRPWPLAGKYIYFFLWSGSRCEGERNLKNRLKPKKIIAYPCIVSCCSHANLY